MEVGPPLGVGSSTLFDTEFLFLLFSVTYARPVDLGASGDSLVSCSLLALEARGLEICFIDWRFALLHPALHEFWGLELRSLCLFAEPQPLIIKGFLK